MKKFLFALVMTSLFIGLNAPAYGASSDDFEVSGWIPYWRVSQGTRDARKHIDMLTEIHPFAWSVQSDGSIKDLGGLKKSAWRRLFADARDEGVRIVPTAMWSDGAAIHAVLSDPAKRADHIDDLVRLVEKGDYDGIDIDYEAKLAATKDSFSLFLKELKDELGDDRILTCAIEARTPPQHLYRTPPATQQYANDLVAIGTHCDRVQIMAYDQRRAIITLNDARTGAPYVPVSDIDWVKMVVEHMALSIPKDKLVLGIPTYGHEYEVTVAPNWYRDYARVRALNPEAAEELADDANAEWSRNKAGEASFTYIPDGSDVKIPRSIKAPKGTPEGNEIAARALAYANRTGTTVKFNIVWWSDREAIERKIELAQELGLRGVALFKIDGDRKADIWDALENAL